MRISDWSSDVCSSDLNLLPPLTDVAWGYRRKGRFSVRRVEKKGKTLVGFRERDPRFVADLSECHTVIPAISVAMPALSALIDGMDGRDRKSVVSGTSGSVSGDPGGRRIIKKKKT